jgi:hypothetical protein
VMVLCIEVNGKEIVCLQRMEKKCKFEQPLPSAKSNGLRNSKFRL